MLNTTENKICSSCRQQLSVSEFYVSRTAPDGLQCYCKGCKRKAARKPEAIARVKEWSAAYAKTETGKATAQRAKEKYKQTDKFKAKREREQYSSSKIEWMKRWRTTPEGRAIRATRARAWVKTPTGQLNKKVQSHKRRTLLKNSSGSFTSQEFIDLCTEYGNVCLKCRRTDLPLTADHILPLSKGGSNFIGNIQPLCNPCNSGKKDKHIDYRIESSQP